MLSNLFLTNTLFFVSIALSLYALWKIYKLPSNDEVLNELSWLEQYVKDIENEVLTYMADTSDRLEGVLRPIVKRNATREVRDRELREKELNSNESIKKHGIISPSDIRKYGITKQAQDIDRFNKE